MDGTTQEVVIKARMWSIPLNAFVDSRLSSSFRALRATSGKRSTSRKIKLPFGLTASNAYFNASTARTSVCTKSSSAVFAEESSFGPFSSSFFGKERKNLPQSSVLEARLLLTELKCTNFAVSNFIVPGSPTTRTCLEMPSFHHSDLGSGIPPPPRSVKNEREKGHSSPRAQKIQRDRVRWGTLCAYFSSSVFFRVRVRERGKGARENKRAHSR